MKHVLCLLIHIAIGVWDLLYKYLKKPINEHYIHAITMTLEEGTMIFTFHPYLLLLVHSADGLHIDTTFKQALGNLKEVKFEFVMWLPAVQCSKILSHCGELLQT